MSNAPAFPMLAPPPLLPKPRAHSMLLMSEVGIPLRVTEDILEIAAPIIDYAKITDHLGLMERLSAAWVRRKIALYNAYGVDVLIGGVPFQVAVVQGKVPEFLRGVRDLGLTGVEMSEDVIKPLPAAQREEWIAMARGMGLAVFTEVGRKNTDIQFDADAIVKQVEHDVKLGVSKIYIESSEIQQLFETDPAGLDRLFKLPCRNQLLFELGLISPQEKAAWLVKRYGTEINFASVSPADVVAVDAIRRGLHRKSEFSYIFDMAPGAMKA